MERELCTYKTASPAKGLPTAANFHFQVLNSHSNNNHYGETFFLAYIPGEVHQQVFERAIVSFEDHYYRAEIEDDNFKRFSRSIRAINTGMEEIRHYYKDHRQEYEYSICIITITESEFLVSACGEGYIIAEDSSHRLHEVYTPEEFLEFSEIISGSHKDLKHLFITLAESSNNPKSNSLEEIAYSVHLTTHGRVESAWFNLIINFDTQSQSPLGKLPVLASTGIIAKAHHNIKRHYRIVKSRIISKKTTQSQPSTHTHKTKPVRAITHRLQSLWTKLWSTYINPNPLRALLIIGGVIAIIIASIIAWNIFGSNSKTSTEYQKIQGLYTNAQASKTNQDTSNSEAQFNQVLKEISSLSATEKTTLNKYASGHKQPTLDEIAQYSQVQLDEIHNIFRVSATKTFSENNFSYSLLTGTSTQLNLLNPATGRLLGYITSSNKTTNKTQTSLVDSKWLVSSTDSPLTYALTQSSVFSVKPDLTVTEARTSASFWPSAQATATYAGNLYFLMPSAGQIYRFRSVGSNQFGPQTNYLKTNDPSLKDAVSFVVGNTIYTTNKSGNIRQYSQNTAQSFTTTGIPSLDNVIQLGYRSSPESLFLLDSSNNSFTLLTIQGNSAVFQKQLVVNNTTNITNFTVDEKNNLLYFVSKDGLFSLPI